MEPHWLNNDERGLWMRLHGLSESLLSDVDSQLRRDAGLTRYEYYVLAMLSESPTRSRLMSDLALATNGSLSRLSHAAAKLEANGWLTRAECASGHGVVPTCETGSLVVAAIGDMLEASSEGA